MLLLLVAYWLNIFGSTVVAKQEGTWPVQNKGVLPQVLHRSHIAGQNSSIKNMIFGDQGATTAEHALFLEYC